MADRSEIVIALAKTFVEFIRHSEPMWRRAFFRFASDDERIGSIASFVGTSEAKLIDPFLNRSFYSQMNELSESLLQALGKDRGLFVLIIDDQFNYDIKFEYADFDRWRISKLDGETGVPVGIDEE